TGRPRADGAVAVALGQSRAGPAAGAVRSRRAGRVGVAPAAGPGRRRAAGRRLRRRRDAGGPLHRGGLSAHPARRPAPPPGAPRRARAALEAIRDELEASGERLLAADPEIVLTPDEKPTVASAHADLPALWGLANAEGYSPLELRRQRELLYSAGREYTTAEL